MKLDIVIILSIILINGPTAKANPVENQVVEDFLEELQLLSHNTNKILKKYVESQFPHIVDSHQQTRIMKALVRRIKGKIHLEILKTPFLAKEDLLSIMMKEMNKSETWKDKKWEMLTSSNKHEARDE